MGLSFLQRVPTGYGAHQASCPKDTAVKRPGREAYKSPPHSSEIKECVELYLHSPISLYGVVLN